MASDAGRGRERRGGNHHTRDDGEQAEAAANWVAVFASGWANPVDTDTFCDHFDPWFDPEVRMIQPSIRPTVGRKGFREEFARPLFNLVPDLHGTVENWSATGDVVYIELRLEGTVGRRAFTCTPATGSSSATGRRSSGSPTSTRRPCSRQSPPAHGPGRVSSARQLRSLRRPA